MPRLSTVAVILLCIFTLFADDNYAPHLTVPDAVRVTFVRDQQIYTANGDGSGVRQLTTGGTWKKMPKWSPDGTEIAYVTEGDRSRDPKSRWKIEVVSRDGQHVGTAPIRVTSADGTEIGTMRGVEYMGWLDDNHVYADGSFNPYNGEFRAIDVHSEKEGPWLAGNGFVTCPAKGWVAFFAPTFPPDKLLRVEVNAEDTDRYIIPDWDKLPSVNVKLLWTPNCQDVALVNAEPPATLILVGAEHGVRKIPLPDWPFENPALSIVNRMLLIRSGSKALLYDFHRNAITEAPPMLLQQLDSDRAAREKVVQELNGISPDWWPAP